MTQPSEEPPGCRVDPHNDTDPLLARLDACLAETRRLRCEHLQWQRRVERELRRMRQIEAELDPIIGFARSGPLTQRA